MTEHGVKADHATLNRLVVEFSTLVAAQAQSKKRPKQNSWRMVETYIRVRGKWVYLYRAVEMAGNTIEFFLPERMNRSAVARFVTKTLSTNAIPSRIVIDNSGANAAGTRKLNRILRWFGCPAKVQAIGAKYRNNMIIRS